MRAPTLASSPHRPDLPVPPSLPNSAISGRIGSCEQVEVHPGENWFALPSPPPPPPSCRSAVPPPFLSSLPCLTRRPLLRRVPASSPRSMSREPDSPVPPSLSLSLGSWSRWSYWVRLAWWRSVQVRTGSFLFWWSVTSLGWIRWMDSSVRIRGLAFFPIRSKSSPPICIVRLDHSMSLFRSNSCLIE
jgi:hypothetical protein